jgi:5-methylcytosine-specific restriction endonuclease McrA
VIQRRKPLARSKKPLKRTALRRATMPIPRRTAPRPRSKKPKEGRLRGKALEALRRDCFERDNYSCHHMITRRRMCLRPVTWETGHPGSGHMAHILALSLGGKDELSNVTAKCAECHLVREHQRGGKPCPPKPKTIEGKL